MERKTIFPGCDSGPVLLFTSFVPFPSWWWLMMAVKAGFLKGDPCVLCEPWSLAELPSSSAMWTIGWRQRREQKRKKEKPNGLKISSLISAKTTIHDPGPKANFSSSPTWCLHPVQPGCAVHHSTITNRGGCNMQKKKKKCPVSFFHITRFPGYPTLRSIQKQGTVTRRETPLTCLI